MCRSEPGVETRPSTGGTVRPSGSSMLPPKTTRSPETSPPGANDTFPPQTITSPDMRAAIRTLERTATTRPGRSCEMTTSCRTEVIEPGTAYREADAPETSRKARTTGRRTALIDLDDLVRTGVCCRERGPGPARVRRKAAAEE